MHEARRPNQFPQSSLLPEFSLDTVDTGTDTDIANVNMSDATVNFATRGRHEIHAVCLRVHIPLAYQN
jgi:hypothetical protein